MGSGRVRRQLGADAGRGPTQACGLHPMENQTLSAEDPTVRAQTESAEEFRHHPPFTSCDKKKDFAGLTLCLRVEVSQVLEGLVGDEQFDALQAAQKCCPAGLVCFRAFADHHNLQVAALQD
jgi:hypothetical protein